MILPATTRHSTDCLRRLAAGLCLLTAPLAPFHLLAQDLLPDASQLPDIETVADPTIETFENLPLPTWGDAPAVLSPRLWPGNSSQTPLSPSEELQLPPAVDPKVIPDLYLADYFGALPDTFLVDPQTLLTAHERSSINVALQQHFAEYKLPVYILLFDKEQEIPEFQNLAAIQTRWFGDSPGAVIGFWLASPTKTNAYFGHALRKQFGLQLDKGFADALGQSYTKSYPFSQLDHFTYTLLWRLAHLDADSTSSVPERHPADVRSTPPEFPPINSSAWIPIALTGFALATAVATLGAAAIVIHRRREHRKRQPIPLILPVSARAKRLGAPHSAGSGAVIKIGHPSPKLPS